MKNYYEILGVAQTSDEETITAAFKALMQKLDSGTHSATAGKDNTKDFNDGYAVLKAYEVLVDPDGRQEYDASLVQTKPQVATPPSPEIPVVAEEEDVVVFTRANSFTEQQPSRWNRALWLLPLLLVGFFLNSQIKNSTDPNEIVTVTVNGTANARAQPTAQGSSVLDTYDVGTELSGTWVDGESGTNERWLKFEVAGQTRYVWDGNLSVAPMPPPSNSESSIASAQRTSGEQELWECNFGDPRGAYTIKLTATSYQFIPYNPDGGALSGVVNKLKEENWDGSLITGLEFVGSAAPPGRWGFVQDQGKRKALLSYAVESSGDGAECTPPGGQPQYVFN